MIYADCYLGPAAISLMDCHAPEVLLEGPAGTGKTRAVLEKLNAIADAYPKCRILVCRDTRASCTESVLVTLERDILQPLKHPSLDRGIGRAHRDYYEYANGSVIVIGGLDRPERLFSTEWDVIYVNEAVEITEDAWELFDRAMRSRRIPLGLSGGPRAISEDGQWLEPQAQHAEVDRITGRMKLVDLYWTQKIADCNPSFPKHWLNQRASTPRMVRIRSTHEDNPSTTPDYLERLRGLTGHRRDRLYEGIWVAAEGSVFPEFDERRHVIAPFPGGIPNGWSVYLGLDPGYDHPCAILMFTVSPPPLSRVYVVAESYQSQRSLEQHAETIRKMTAGLTVTARYADPQHAFSSTAQSPRTIAQQLKDLGAGTWTRWPRSTDKEPMVERVRQYLIDDRLRVFGTCPNVVSELQSWRYKRDARGQMTGGDDQYVDADNHAIDVICGLLAQGIGEPRPPVVSSRANNRAWRQSSQPHQIQAAYTQSSRRRV